MQESHDSLGTPEAHTSQVPIATLPENRLGEISLERVHMTMPKDFKMNKDIW